jgi:hypothetical protein
MWGSIPIEDHMFPGVISTVSNFFENHKEGTCLNGIRKADFSDLLRLCLTSDTIQVNNGLFQQKGKGLQMGNNVSGACAIIFMDFVENQILQELGDNIVEWKRYVDDVFVIYKGMETGQLVEMCNDIHPDISFTIEEPIMNGLPFLDVFVKVVMD